MYNRFEVLLKVLLAIFNHHVDTVPPNTLPPTQLACSPGTSQLT